MELVLQNLSKSFDKNGTQVKAVDSVNLTVEKGEFITFLGPSGCGKTTTLRMIAGFEEPTAGSVLLGRTDITALPANKRDLGFVFQNYALFPHMTVENNVAYGLKVRKLPVSEVNHRTVEALEAVGLSGEGKRYPNQLSGGQQQRVALARALVLRPKLLLMDEPLSNLDAKLRAHMRGEIRRIQREWNLTCLYVTHDQKEALTMSDRIMVMNAGKVEQIGTPGQLYSDPASAFVADFIGNANLIAGQISTACGKPQFVRGSLSLPARLSQTAPVIDGTKVYLVVRPERFVPCEQGFTATITQALFEGDRISYLATMDDGTDLEFSLPAEGTVFIEGQTVKLAPDAPAAVVPA